jgi:hypothetical protein
MLGLFWELVRRSKLGTLLELLRRLKAGRLTMVKGTDTFTPSSHYGLTELKANGLERRLNLWTQTPDYEFNRNWKDYSNTNCDC